MCQLYPGRASTPGRGAVRLRHRNRPRRPARSAWHRGAAGLAIDFETLEQTGYAEFDYQTGDFESAGFKTPSGKIELFSERLDQLGLDPLPDYAAPRSERETAKVRTAYPLILLTGAREKTYHHSRYRDQAWARKVSPYPLLEIHPETASSHGLERDDWVKIETPGADGSCELKVKLTEDVAPGILRTTP